MNEDLLRSISKSLFEAFASIHATNNVSAGNAANNVKREDKNMSRRSITLGTWDGKPIEWLVLKEEGLATLVISRYPLLSHKFNENTNDKIPWKNSLKMANGLDSGKQNLLFKILVLHKTLKRVRNNMNHAADDSPFKVPAINLALTEYMSWLRRLC